MSSSENVLHSRKPAWLKIRPPGGAQYREIKTLLRGLDLHTVCEEAHCPNLAECWQSGTATLMIGGDTCTRGCRFCAVKNSAEPAPLDPDEPKKIARAVLDLKLRTVVLTTVTRDDLPDQGAEHFSRCIRAIQERVPGIIVEALLPDFRAEPDCIRPVIESGLQVFAHNIETVEELQGKVRDSRAGFQQSLKTLRIAREMALQQGKKLYTKSGMLLGLGETFPQIEAAMIQLRNCGVEFLTLGQDLQPTARHLKVERYVTPEEFKALESLAGNLGFLFVASGPLIRSSYRAGEFFRLQKESE